MTGNHPSRSSAGDGQAASSADALRAKAIALLRAQQAGKAAEQADAEPPVASTAEAEVPGGARHAQDHIEDNEAAGVCGFGEFHEDIGADAGPVDAVQFEECGQDRDHLLQVHELNWESTNVAKSLPPGWAKCPNAGTPFFDLTPVKVGCSPVGAREVAQAAVHPTRSSDSIAGAGTCCIAQQSDS